MLAKNGLDNGLHFKIHFILGLHQSCIKVAENIAKKEMQPKTLGCTILLASMFNIQVLSGLTRLSY